MMSSPGHNPHLFRWRTRGSSETVANKVVRPNVNYYFTHYIALINLWLPVLDNTPKAISSSFLSS